MHTLGKISNVLRDAAKVIAEISMDNAVLELFYFFFFFLFMYFYPGTITTQVESINSDLQLGLDRHLRHTQH